MPERNCAGGGGKESHKVLIVDDRPERILAPEQLVGELEQVRAELERRNDELRQFANSAAHDLKAPLRHLRFFLESLIERHRDHFSEEDEKDYGFVESALKRMQILIEQLLEYAHVGSDAHCPEVVDVRAIAQEIAQGFSVDLERVCGRLSIGEIPPVTGDPRLLRKLLEKLIGNAIKYSREGVPPDIDVRGSRPDDGEIWELRVQDNGRGIELEYRDQVFKPFRRLAAGTEGSGLGLAIVERIVSRHCGEVTLESEPGAGSTFTVTLPACSTSPSPSKR